MQSITCLISPWNSGLGRICADRIAPNPVELVIVNSGCSVTGSTSTLSGSGGMTLSILPESSRKNV